MRIWPRRRHAGPSGVYDGPVAFMDGWHYPADHVGEDGFRLVRTGLSEHGTAQSAEDAAAPAGWRFARDGDRPHNDVHERAPQVFELHADSEGGAET